MRVSIGVFAMLVVVVSSAADAEDLPVAEPLQNICLLWGPGFHPVPGTETCARVSGSVSVEAGYFGGDGLGSREENRFGAMTRGMVRLETRTETDFGTIRTVIELDEALGQDDWLGAR